jgi:uncharacterized protein (TIGR03435 family)
MLQTLLEDRFSLKFQRENRNVPGFALVTAKNGTRLVASTSEDEVLTFGSFLKPVPGQPITINARKYSLAMLAMLLSQISPDPVIDKTGLKGNWDFKLSFDESNGPSLVTALQEQLGLTLESQKVPVSDFVFESAQRPSAN